MDGHWWLSINLLFKCTFEDVDNFFPIMFMLGGKCSHAKIDSDLDGFVPGDADVMALEINSSDAWLVRVHFRP